MKISNNRIVIERIEEPKKEGFEVVAMGDTFTYKGRVIIIPEMPIYMGNKQVESGDTVLFAKYSPDTHEIEDEGKKMRFVKTDDLLAIL